ncbi:DUF3575 domain-containing protein [Algoriphagus sp. AK58]|uniref:DUF3575 domain-containing protein n=1 Tax=Algoriphagus sp. AK58 TaxID=1406877 RepID=UPI00164F7E6F|nr:DUF3575 domain-containing protein [Algoriphagus sp. AK58]
MKTYLISLLFTMLMTGIAFAQDSALVAQRKNTIKLDLTGNLIYSNSFNLSYERLVKQNQSFVFTAGIQEFPSIINLGENVEGKREDARSGFKFGGEYRFYLKKENKFATPRGLYVGPYITALGFKSDRKIIYSGTDVPEEANLKSRLNILSVGAQLGYQFIFNDRWSLDLVLIGPSYSRYNFKTQLSGDFEFDADNVENEILRALIEKFPMLDDVLDEQELESSGDLDTWALGYKYQVLVGYRFGKYKKLKK